jgi:uncharacterized protein YqgC (DUF456 family)
MRRSVLVLAMALVFVLAMAASALAGPPAHGESKFGKGITSHCGATYGQLVSAAIQSGHIEGPVSGARGFVESGLFAAHCLGD